jgi:hypothetical protein
MHFFDFPLPTLSQKKGRGEKKAKRKNQFSVPLAAGSSYLRVTICFSKGVAAFLFFVPPGDLPFLLPFPMR